MMEMVNICYRKVLTWLKMRIPVRSSRPFQASFTETVLTASTFNRS